jgi:uncharacterized protein (TIGR02118 family)
MDPEYFEPARNDALPPTASACAQLEDDMAKMVVIFKTPSNPAAFDKHYFDVHAPLAKRLPGLRRYETSTGPVELYPPGNPPYLVTTLYFDSLADIHSAFATEVGKACAADRRALVPDDGRTMLLYDDTAL